MRTHWGTTTLLCRHCKQKMSVVLIESHQREGISCHHCFRKTVTGGEVMQLIAQIEESEERSDRWGGKDAA